MRVNEAIQYLHRMDPREPVIILRGQDALAPKTILRWIELAEVAGVAPVKIQGMLDMLVQFMHWPTRKLPD